MGYGQIVYLSTPFPKTMLSFEISKIKLLGGEEELVNIRGAYSLHFVLQEEGEVAPMKHQLTETKQTSQQSQVHVNDNHQTI